MLQTFSKTSVTYCFVPLLLGHIRAIPSLSHSVPTWTRLHWTVQSIHTGPVLHSKDLSITVVGMTGARLVLTAIPLVRV
jgi:hypothetical protein